MCVCASGSWGKHGIPGRRLFAGSIVPVLHGTLPFQLQRRADGHLDEAGGTTLTVVFLTNLFLPQSFRPLSLSALSAGAGLRDPMHTRVQFRSFPVQADSSEGLEHSGPSLWRVLYWEWSYRHARKPVSMCRCRCSLVNRLKCIFKWFCFFFSPCSKMASDGGPSRTSSQVDQEYGDEQSKSWLIQCYSDSLSVTLISIYCWRVTLLE